MPSQPPADHAEFAATGRRLLELIQRASIIHISRRDDEPDTCVVLISAMFDEGERWVNLSRSSVELALAALAGEEPQKICSGRCGQGKPLSAYPLKPSSGDGRGSMCLGCDRARQRERGYNIRANRRRRREERGKPEPAS